jgi:hypothetical protein
MNILEIYNPANAASLTDEQITAMRSLSVEQIAELAKAYPNGPTGNSYLRLHDKNLADDKQIYPLSTWQNLHNLHKISNFNFTPISFTKNYVAPVLTMTNNVPPRTKDLADADVAGAEGLKKADENKVPEVVKEATETKVADADVADADVAGAEGKTDAKKEEEKPAQEVAYEAAVAALEEAKKAGAHKHTIKELQAKVDAFEAK